MIERNDARWAGALLWGVTLPRIKVGLALAEVAGAGLDLRAKGRRGLKGGEADTETRKLLGTLADDMAALRARLAEKGKELAAASRDESAGKPKSPARMRATALKDLDAVQKRELMKMLIRRVELTPNGIVLNPFDGEPIVGEVLERQGVRSSRWRFIEVEWLN